MVICVRTEAENVRAVNGLRLRSDTSTDSTILAKLPYGTEVEVIESGLGDGNWSKVETEFGNGHVWSSWLTTDKILKEDKEDYEYLGNFHITAYTHTGNVCANGNYPTAGYTVACNSLDFGTQIYIEGIGVRTVEDRGLGWLGSEWLDLFCDSLEECVAWGSQYKDVYIVKKGN